MRDLPGRGRASHPCQVLGTPSRSSSFGLGLTHLLSFFPSLCLFLLGRGAGSLVTQAGLEFSVWRRMACFCVLGAGSVDV